MAVLSLKDWHSEMCFVKVKYYCLLHVKGEILPLMVRQMPAYYFDAASGVTHPADGIEQVLLH